MAECSPASDLFDDSHYASSLVQKLKRSLQLGPKYYALDLPRYFRSRKALSLPFWDWRALLNPLHEFRGNTSCEFPLPPRYAEALEHLRQAGVRLTMPCRRLEALLGAWWSARQVPGDAIECGSYRGATTLLLALLGRMNQVGQMVLMLDTFEGIPQTSRFDVSRSRGEFVPAADQVGIIREQARALGISDRIAIHRGLFAETFAALTPDDPHFAFVHIDANIYQGTLEACQFAIPRTAPGGVVVFDDYNGVCDLGARLAIDHFHAGRAQKPLPLAGSSAWIQIPAPSASEIVRA
jgi:hypothetical protein